MRIKLLLILFCTSILFGCGIFRQRTVNKNSNSAATSSDLKLKVDSTVKKTDKTVILERESVDTTVKTSEQQVNSTKSTSLKELSDGLTTIDSGLVSVKVTLDSTTMKLTTHVVVKPRLIPVKIDKYKATYTDKTEEAAKNTDQHNKVATELRSDSKVTVAKPKGLGWLWIIIVSVVILIGVGAWLFLKRYLPPPKPKEDV